MNASHLLRKQTFDLNLYGTNIVCLYCIVTFDPSIQEYCVIIIYVHRCAVEIVVKNEEVHYSPTLLNNVYYYTCISDNCSTSRVLTNKFQNFNLVEHERTVP